MQVKWHKLTEDDWPAVYNDLWVWRPGAKPQYLPWVTSQIYLYKADGSRDIGGLGTASHWAYPVVPEPPNE